MMNKLKHGFLTALIGFAITAEAKVKLVTAMPLHVQKSYQYLQPYSGRLVSQQITHIGFNLKPGWTGRITGILVDTGDSFKKGDKLATVDTRVIDLHILQILEKIKEAKLQLSQAITDRRRMKRYNLPQHRKSEQKKKFLTAQRVLESKIKQLKHQLDIEKTLLTKHTLRAPYDGVVTNRFLSIGTTVRSGEPLFQIIDTQNYQVNIGIPQHSLKQLQINKRITVHVSNRKLNGIVKSISPQENARTLTHNVLIKIDASGNPLPNQAIARIDLPITVKKKGAWVPLTAIEKNFQGLWSIYALNKLSENRYKVLRQDTQVIFSDKNKVYVDTHLQNNTLIVRDGLFRIIPGDVVNIHQGNLHEKK